MMIYKKPTFWIVIAAVALCIVVAVCFLANPKNYGPKVGNPQMLELPGVEWFATPEEVKAALNITEDQILTEYTTSGFVLEMYVTDLTLFGREVPLARFDFWFNNSGNTALRYALVFFSEDTNMKKLEKELVEIYGPGQSESYVHSLYDNNIDLVKRFDYGVFGLETSAKNEDGYNALDGNPFRDALEDPDYMIHHWVTENGLSVIPEEVVEYFKSGEVEDMPQDEDKLMKTLDRMPWIVMTMSNRNATAIYHDIMGAENELEQLYTNNYIQFSARLLAECLYTAQGSD